MRTWFTSDTHFGHKNIINYSKRPFSSAEEMDEALICKWNSVVGVEDEVWHLGDFAFRNSRAVVNYVRRLNGRIHLIWGNHDSDETRSLGIWASSQPYAEIIVSHQPIVLLHYGMRVWNRSHRGAIHLYGHSHGSLAGDSGSCDVGVDNPAFAYKPASLEQIMRHLRTLTPRTAVDHHGKGD